jgi:SHO1 osmosensor
LQSGWLIAFVSSIVADISQDYPNYSWWCLVYMLFLMIGVIFVVGSDSVFTYHVAMAALLSAGLVFTTSSVNSLIYSASPAKEAAAAGFILLSIDTVRTLYQIHSTHI